MTTKEQNKWGFLERLYMKTVIFSYIINDSKNIKGILINNFDAKLDKESIIFTGDDNIEILYQHNDVENIEYDELNDNYVLSIIDGTKMEIAVT
jgi:hypothetical protein